MVLGCTTCHVFENDYEVDFVILEHTISAKVKKEIITFSGAAMLAFQITEIKHRPDNILPDLSEVHYPCMTIPAGVKIYGEINIPNGQYYDRKTDSLLITQLESTID